MGQFAFSFGLLAVVGLCYLMLSANRIKLIEPGKLMLLGWLPGLCLLASGVIVYDQAFTLTTFTVVAFSLIFFTLGSIIGNSAIGSKQKNPNTTYRNSFDGDIDPFVKYILIFITLIYIAIIAYENVTSSTSFIRGGFGGLRSARDAHWEQMGLGDGTVGFLDFIKAMSRSGAIYLILCFSL